MSWETTRNVIQYDKLLYNHLVASLTSQRWLQFALAPLYSTCVAALVATTISELLSTHSISTSTCVAALVAATIS